MQIRSATTVNTLVSISSEKIILRLDALKYLGEQFPLMKRLTPSAYPSSLCLKFEFISWWPHLALRCSRDLSAGTGSSAGARDLPPL